MRKLVAFRITDELLRRLDAEGGTRTGVILRILETGLRREDGGRKGKDEEVKRGNEDVAADRPGAKAKKAKCPRCGETAGVKKWGAGFRCEGCGVNF